MHHTALKMVSQIQQIQSYWTVHKCTSEFLTLVAVAMLLPLYNFTGFGLKFTTRMGMESRPPAD